MEAIKQAFAGSKAQCRAALITYLRAGCPTVEDTPEIMLAMQAGGADIIQLGMPSTKTITGDPMDQYNQEKTFANDVRIPVMLQIVKSARRQGLAVPVLLIGRGVSIFKYPFGEEKLLRDCSAAGVDGLIILDLPCSETLRLSGLCKAKGLSLIPVVTSATLDDSMEKLCSVADSFVYINHMAVVRAAEEGFVDSGLGELLGQVRAFIDNFAVNEVNDVSVAVGDVKTCQHFVKVVGPAVEGVVVRAPIASILEDATPGTGSQQVKDYCLAVARRAEAHVILPQRQNVRQPMSSTTVYLAGDGANDSPDRTDKQKNEEGNLDVNARFDTSANDKEALEGIIPALESSHAIAGAVVVAKEVESGGDVVICLSGRGDKDAQTVLDVMPAVDNAF